MDDFVLGDRELDVMGVLWDLGSGTVAEVRERLPADLAYTTVLTILRNLEAKELVTHTAEGKAHRYVPRVARRAARRSALTRIVDKLFHGSPEQLIAQLVEDESLSAEDTQATTRAAFRADQEGHGRISPMIAWMLYAAVIGALVGIAGLALERVAAARAIPMRFVWLATMIVSVGWAVASAVRRLLPDVAEPVRLVPFTITLEPTRAIAGASMDAGSAAMFDRALDRIVDRAQRRVACSPDQSPFGRSDARALNGVPRTSTESPFACRRTLVRPSSGFARWTSCYPNGSCRSTPRCGRSCFVTRRSIGRRAIHISFRVGDRRRAHAVEPRALASGETTAAGDRDGLRRASTTRASVAGAIRIADAHHRAAPLDAPPMFAPMLSEPTSQLERRILAMRTTTRKSPALRSLAER